MNLLLFVLRVVAPNKARMLEHAFQFFGRFIAAKGCDDPRSTVDVDAGLFFLKRKDSSLFMEVDLVVTMTDCYLAGVFN